MRKKSCNGSIAKEAVPNDVSKAYGGAAMTFGADYIIPKPTDERLLGRVAAAVAQAAVDTGVAHLPYPSHYPLRGLRDVK